MSGLPEPGSRVSCGAIEPADATLVLPCLNEARTLGALIAEAQAVLLTDAAARWTILVADNGSTDGSIAIAEAHGARVVPATPRGYGAAVSAGIAAATTPWVVYADADGTYDPRDAIALLAAARAHDADLVVGSRLRGAIAPGAMPALHRHLGTPALSLAYRLLYRVPITDVNSGMRCVRRSAYGPWAVRATGMELASAMLVEAAHAGARIVEIPIGLRRAPPDRTPHLRPWRDGLRHLAVLVGGARRGLGLALIAYLAIVGVIRHARLIEGAGVWYAPDVTLRLQGEALLRGELTLQAQPLFHLPDWAWSPHGAQQLWGLGVPLIRLPLELLARACGERGFPDRVVIVMVMLAAGLLLTLALARARASPWPVRAAIAGFALAHPALGALLHARFAVYEEVVAMAVLLGLAQLGLLGLLATKARPDESAPRTATPGARRAWLALAFVAGLAITVRPTALFPALASLLVGLVGARRAGLRAASLASGVALWALGPAVVALANHARFDDAFELGYRLNLSLVPTNEAALRFGYPFASEPLLSAARELIALLFLHPSYNAGYFYAHNVHAWQSSTLRFRELYFGTYGLADAALVVGGVAAALVLALRRRRSRTPTERIAAAWSAWGALAFALTVAFYLRAPSITSRYLLDLHPAIVALAAALGLATIRARLTALVAPAIAVIVFATRDTTPRPYELIYPITAELAFGKTDRLLAQRALPAPNYPAMRACPGDVRTGAIPADGLDWAADCTVGVFTNVFLPPSRCVRVRLTPLDDRARYDEVAARSDLDEMPRATTTATDTLSFCLAEEPPRPRLVSLVFAAPRGLDPDRRTFRVDAISATDAP